VGLALDLEDCHPSVLLHSWLGHFTCKIVSEMTYNVWLAVERPLFPIHSYYDYHHYCYCYNCENVPAVVCCQTLLSPSLLNTHQGLIDLVQQFLEHMHWERGKSDLARKVSGLSSLPVFYVCQLSSCSCVLFTADWLLIRYNVLHYFH